jgi:MFS family permease
MSDDFNTKSERRPSSRSTFESLSLTIDNDQNYDLEDILNKIGYTKYHYIMIFLVGLTLMADGVELYLINLIGPVLKSVYNFEQSFLTTIVTVLFIGIAIGAFFGSYLFKKYGRRFILLLFLLIVSLFGTICVAIDNIYWFIFCRFIIGISIGILFNFTNALCEILPIKNRDFIMGSIYIFLKGGIAYFLIIYYAISSYSNISHSYKFVIYLSNIPMYIALILALLFYKESPRILLWENNIPEAYNELQRIAEGSNYVISKEDLLCLNKFVKARNLSVQENLTFKHSIELLISKSYIKLFILLIILWLMNTVNIYTNVYYLPVYLRTILHKTLPGEDKLSDTNVIHKLLIAVVLPMPAEILSGLMTSNKAFGRIRTILIGFTMQMVFSIASAYDMDYFYLFSSFITFFNIFSFNITKLYTSEVFDTNLRDIGYGISNFISRLVVIFVPLIVDTTIVQSQLIPCYLMIVYSFLGAITALLLPYDTHGKKLDAQQNS